MVSHILIDIDGTLVYPDGRPVEGAPAWLRARQLKGDRFMLITNNTKASPAALHAQLTKAGFDIEPNTILSCLSAAVEVLRERGISNCFIYGNVDLRNFFRSHDIEVTEGDEPVGAVIVGAEPCLTNDKLSIGLRAVLNGALLIALHNKKICRERDGRIGMDVGGTVAALEYCSGTNALVMGKPSKEFYQLGIRKLNTTAQQVFIISDDPLADLVAAKYMGMRTIFVRTGTYKDDGVLAQMPTDALPDEAFDKISDIQY